MEDAESGDETTSWTQENLQKLLASLKESAPENKKTQTYIRGLNAVDWDKVAFPPFSAEECKEKWNSMMAKMRRYRSLPELLDEAEHVLSDPVQYKNIHPDVPKRPVTPKMAYIGQNISRYTKKHPGRPTGELTRKFSKMYDKLPDEKKAKYIRNFKLQYDEYSRRMLNFCAENHLPLPRKSNSKRNAPEEGGEGCSREEGLPKKPPRHGRGLFLKEQSNIDGSSLGVSFLKVMGERWRKMSKEQQQEYNKRCAKMKREYDAKLVEYINRLDETEKQRLIEEKKIKIRKKPLDRYVILPGEPKMPPRSGFIYFYKEDSEKSSETLTRKGRMDLAKKNWYKLSAKKKNHYAIIIRKNMRKYKEDLQKWFETLAPTEKTDYLLRKPNKIQFLYECLRVKEAVTIPSGKEDENEEDGDMFEEY